MQDILQYKEPQPNTAVGYFYFDFNDDEKRSFKKAIRSLLFQFALQTSNRLQDLESLYEKYENGQQQPAESTIQLLLQDKIALAERAYIVLDALNECTDREPLLIFLHKLIDVNENLCILATSRREKNIEDQLSAVADYNINIKYSVIDIDIALYVRDRLVTDSKLKKWPPAVQEEITTALIKKAGGMYGCSVDHHTLSTNVKQVSMGILSARRYSKVR